MTAPARRAALRVLRDIESGRADLPHAQARVRPTLDDRRDRALVNEIVVGTLRWRAALDHVVRAASSRSLDRIDPDILDLLRLSAYQLLYLKRVPAHAIVNDAVQLARDLGKPSAAPYVNAVLRAVASGRATELPPAPLGPQTHLEAIRRASLDYLSTTLSHPRWLVERWYERYGYDATERWARFDNLPAPITLRANTRLRSAGQLAEELAGFGVETSAATWAPHALIVTRGNPLDTGLAQQGLFWLQDEASQLVGDLVDARPGSRVFDACASPGGKSLTIRNRMSDQGVLVSSDVRAGRTELLAETLSRAGVKLPTIVRCDARRPPFGPVFDWVLLDAPCSGLGTLRRDPDIRWRRTPQDLPRMSALQLELLEGAATVVSPGGALVYATCSSEPEENDDVVGQFLHSHSMFRLAPPSEPRWARFVGSDGYVRTLPHRDGLQAFFAARLRRENL